MGERQIFPFEKDLLYEYMFCMKQLFDLLVVRKPTQKYTHSYKYEISFIGFVLTSLVMLHI